MALLLLIPFRHFAYFYFVSFFKEFVIPAGIAGIQAPWMDRSLPSMALDARFQADMTAVFKCDKVEPTVSA
ncbi:hypothetical protein NP590_16810 [Methylomonas sp. SURF-2]|uniref:Uncharacterized protein n=1 Tax=Methylomonas subterranea TaxID=2952225 RepID=A0ABT1TJZ5_9GAMM|nr:hypothetical protein [Methylomonas sp. SURF-2]MCQ8105773.1 hypothetical protein [Methylomonas sp. SURF-2]